MKYNANVSSNAAAEQVQFFFLMQFVLIQVRSQENILLHLFRNTFDNSWVNVYWDWCDEAW